MAADGNPAEALSLSAGKSEPAEAETSGPGRLSEVLDEAIWALLARSTGGASPIALATAWYDWLSHMAISPGHRTRLGLDASREWMHALRDVWLDAAGVAMEKRWQPGPVMETALRGYGRAYSHWADWLSATVSQPNGVSSANARRVAFTMRQALEAFHPRNFLWTNPDALAATQAERGANLARGWMHLIQDMQAQLGLPATRAERPALGEKLAATPGKVVYRNRLIELIQYAPAGDTVKAEPILITPAWILKFYILDLNSESSLVRYLVEQGYTVFMISWRNPSREHRDLGFDDYRQLGVLSAIEAIQALMPGNRIHGVGYCLGGTLLSVTAADLARNGDDPFASLTLLAAQVDFRDAGELSIFIDEAQLAALNAGMDAAGYLHGHQMAAAFTLLRSRELVWRRVQEEYLMGRRGQLIDLMVWNGDTTNMPYRMHSEYLRHFFLDNDFVQGRFVIDGKPVAVSDIRAPVFALGTTKDHVAPWRSVFKIHLFADTEVTFVLATGGHNAGVVSPPGHPRRRHGIHTRADCEHYVDPDTWLEIAEEREGSWWPSWVEWLGAHSSGEVPAPEPVRAELPGNELPAGASLPDAPGDYVREGA